MGTLDNGVLSFKHCQSGNCDFNVTPEFTSQINAMYKGETRRVVGIKVTRTGGNGVF